MNPFIAQFDLPGNPERSPFFPVLRRRILHRHDAAGWRGLVGRVVTLASEAEEPWTEPDRDIYMRDLRNVLLEGAFLPNSPLLVNAGEQSRRLFACFAVDSRRPIDQFLSVARQVHDGMGGVGYSLGWLQDPKSIEDYIRRVDDDTAKHQLGRPRPASNAVTIPISHPGAEAILNLSGKMAFTNLNLGIPNAFMESLITGEPAELECFKRLAKSIHETGQPGVIFTDRIPRLSRESNAPFAANVCGEAPLAADESALLGSLNLLQFVSSRADGGLILDEVKLARVTRLAVRFLDGMHDVHSHPCLELEENSRATRKIGVGIMGFAHLLPLLGIRYGEQDSIHLAEKIGDILMTESRRESRRLAGTRGACLVSGQRNAVLVAIAGTATLALLTGTTGGVEPVFSHVSRQRVMGEELQILDPIISYWARNRGLDEQAIASQLLAGVPLATLVGKDLARLLPTACDIPGEHHIAVQAAFQRKIDGGITKTVNCSANTTPAQIAAWLRLAYADGCLGLTFYRDGSRVGQPVQNATQAA